MTSSHRRQNNQTAGGGVAPYIIATKRLEKRRIYKSEGKVGEKGLVGEEGELDMCHAFPTGPGSLTVGGECVS